MYDKRQTIYQCHYYLCHAGQDKIVTNPVWKMLLPDTILVIDEHPTEHNLSTSSLVRELASFQGMSQREELSESYHPPYAPCDLATPDDVDEFDAPSTDCHPNGQEGQHWRYSLAIHLSS